MKKLIIIITAVFLMTASLSWASDTPVRFSSIDTELKNEYALNSFGDYYVTGIGAGAQANFMFGFVENLGLFTSVDYFYGISKTIWVDSFQDLSFAIGASYTFLPNNPVSIIPEISYGGCGHILPGDIDRNGTKAISFYFDQMLNLAIKVVYPLNEDLLIFLSPELTLFLESENRAVLAGYNLGVRINL